VITLEEIKSSNELTIAIVVKKDYKKEGVNFVSKSEYPLQLAVSSYKAGHKINDHLHQKREITINNIQEVVYFKSGEALVSLFGEDKKLVRTLKLSAGDVVFFVNGGHGFKMSKDTTIIEVKQGPYFGKDLDKVIIE